MCNALHEMKFLKELVSQVVVTYPATHSRLTGRFATATLPRLQMLHLVIDFVDHLMICLQFEQRHFEITRTLNVGQNERVHVHRRLVAIDGQRIALFLPLLSIICKLKLARISFYWPEIESNGNMSRNFNYCCKATNWEIGNVFAFTFLLT